MSHILLYVLYSFPSNVMYSGCIRFQKIYFKVLALITIRFIWNHLRRILGFQKSIKLYGDAVLEGIIDTIQNRYLTFVDEKKRGPEMWMICSGLHRTAETELALTLSPRILRPVGLWTLEPGFFSDADPGISRACAVHPNKPRQRHDFWNTVLWWLIWAGGQRKKSPVVHYCSWMYTVHSRGI